MRQGRTRRKDLRDLLGIKAWQLGFLGQDGERTPMLWLSEPGAGFSSCRPWLPINAAFPWRNMESQSADPTVCCRSIDA